MRLRLERRESSHLIAIIGIKIRSYKFHENLNNHQEEENSFKQRPREEEEEEETSNYKRIKSCYQKR